ncbi:MAG: hypothetical protein PF961_21785 [Planctomycetota bacterium]|nr:hypothetical protein [Planctomycetota bacterium]
MNQRSGAALILAMIVLSALLLMGLPFLLSQSYSLGGSMSFRAKMAASSGRDSAESLGIALAAHTSAYQFHNENSEQGEMREAIIAKYDPSAASIWIDDNDPARIHIDTSLVTAGALNRLDANDPVTVHTSLTIEDGSSLIDINDLDEAGWDRLLKDHDIVDWDDNVVVDSQDWLNDDGSPADERFWIGTAANGDEDDDDGDGTQYNYDNDDGDDYGELAESLANLRFNNKYKSNGYRVNNLEDLLLADPGHNTETPRTTTNSPYGTNADVDGNYSFGFRRPLTEQEFARIKPLLTTRSRSQSRANRQDLGTVLYQYDASYTSGNRQKWNLRVLDGDVSDVLAAGTVIHAVDGSLAPRRSWRTSSSNWKSSQHATDDIEVLLQGDTLSIEIPSPVNLNHAPGPVLNIVTGVSSLSRASGNPSYPIVDFADMLDFQFNAATHPYKVPNIFVLAGQNGSGRTRPPASSRTWGIYHIQSAATASDAKDRPVSTASRSIIVQALPQDPGQALVLPWRRQDQMEVLRRRLSLSRMVTWPRAVNRIPTSIPAMADGPDEMMRSAPETTYAEVEDPPVERLWSRPMEDRAKPNPAIALADFSEALTKGDGEAPPETGSISDANFTPEGVRISDAISYRLDGASDRPFEPVGDLNEVGGRQLSLWIRPEAAWNSEVTLIEMRAPPAGIFPAGTGNCFEQIDATPGSNELQNLWRLYYDGATEYLVLHLANPVIEHTSDIAIRDPTGFLPATALARAMVVPEDIFAETDPASPASLYFNEQCLGASNGAGAPSPLVLSPLAPAMPMNHIEFRYKVVGGLQQGNWYHLQLAVSHDRPGGQAILLNGFAGRDVADAGVTLASDLRTGDHITLPSMLLAQDLIAEDLVGDDSGTTMVLGNLTLSTTAIHADLGLDATSFFPARGTARIGNEYISYTGRTATSLTGCYRGIRSNTNVTAVPADNHLWWPVLEAHSRDDLVVPGGYRFDPPDTGLLLAGLAHTLQEFHNGDPSDNYRVWSDASKSVSDYDAATHTESIGGVTIMTLGESTDGVTGLNPSGIVLDDSNGVAATQFPDGSPGIVRIEGASLGNFTTDASGTIVSADPPSHRIIYLYFANYDKASQTLTGLEMTDAAFLAASASPAQIRFCDDAGGIGLPTTPPKVTLISLHVDSNELDATRFTDHADKRNRQFQIMASDGRVEWVSYDQTWVHTSTSQGFFVDYDGFDRGDRGRERTIFAPAYGGTGVDPSATFASGSRIVPVQTRLGTSSWIATGDVVTLMPVPDPSDPTDRIDPTDPAKTPVQMVVRLAATDGYRDSDATSVLPAPSNCNADVKNEWFAFTDGLPAPLVGERFEILSGNCWSGFDLSGYQPVARANLKKGLMPRMDQMSTTFALGDDPAVPPFPAPPPGDARCYFGGGDSRYGGLAAGSMLLDAITAGGQPGSAVGMKHLGQVTGFTIAGAPSLLLDATSLDFEIEIDTDDPSGANYFRTASTNDLRNRYGLCLVGSEVMAYERIANDRARIFGRGLLGSTAQEHKIVPTIDNLLNERWRNGPSFVHLPLGPIAILGEQYTNPESTSVAPFDNNFRGPIRFATSLYDGFTQAPCYLLAKPDGSAYEIAYFVKQDGRYYTGPWLRGAYGSTPIATLDPGDIVIAWWPRYAPGLPASNLTDEHLRCRTYAWAGFPVRFHNTLLDSSLADTITVEANIDTALSFELRANYGSSIDTWLSRPVYSTTGAITSSTNLTSLFADFPTDQDINGAELRINWRYNSSTSDLFEMSRRMGISPEIDEVVFRVNAPTKVLEYGGRW